MFKESKIEELKTSLLRVRILGQSKQEITIWTYKCCEGAHENIDQKLDREQKK